GKLNSSPLPSHRLCNKIVIVSNQDSAECDGAVQHSRIAQLRGFIINRGENVDAESAYSLDYCGMEVVVCVEQETQGTGLPGNFSFQRRSNSARDGCWPDAKAASRKVSNAFACRAISASNAPL